MCEKDRKISSVTGDGEEHSMIWGMFMAVTMESAVLMGKNFHNSRNSIVNTTDLTLKQMIDISAKLVSEQDELSGLETIGCENHSWKYMSLIGEGPRLFRFCIVSWEDLREPPIEGCMGRKISVVQIISGLQKL